MSNKWMAPNVYLTRLVTRHRLYWDYIACFKQPWCKCSKPCENPSHVLNIECQLLFPAYLARLERLLKRPNGEIPQLSVAVFIWTVEKVLVAWGWGRGG